MLLKIDRMELLLNMPKGKTGNYQVKGAIWNTLGSGMYAANTFVMLALVSRVSTVQQTGYFGIALTTAQILYMVGLFGMNTYQMTDYQEKHSFLEYARAKVVTCLLMAAGCVLSIWVLGFEGKKAQYTVLLTVLMMLNAIGELFQSLFFQKNRLDLSGSALFHRTLWPLISFSAVLVYTRNILFAITVQILGNLFITLYYAIKVVPRFISPVKHHTALTENVKELLVECLPLFFSMFLMTSIINASKYGIEFLMDDTAQGYYNMIFMPVQVINLCTQFLFKPLLNQYAKLIFQKQYKAFGKVIIKQSILTVAFTVFCAIAAYFMGTQVLGLVYNKDISAYKYVLTWVVVAGGVYAICQLFYYILVILRKQKQILSIYIGGAVAAVILTWLCVAHLGLWGGALSFLLVHLLILASYVYLLAVFIRKDSADANDYRHIDCP